MILAITQARMSSTRLPGKVLMEIDCNTLLDLHVQRVARSRKIDKHVIAISDNSSDDVLEAYCKQHQLDYCRGSENDVLDRFYKAAKPFAPETVVRLTADCPLIDAELIDKTISLYLDAHCDYASNTLVPAYPDGLDAEVFSFKALEKAWQEATLKSDREHVTAYIWRNSSLKGGDVFRSCTLGAEKDLSALRMTVDEQEDFLLIKTLVEKLGTGRPWIDYANYIIQHNIDLNAKFSRNEGYFNSLKKDK